MERTMAAPNKGQSKSCQNRPETKVRTIDELLSSGLRTGVLGHCDVGDRSFGEGSVLLFVVGFQHGVGNRRSPCSAKSHVFDKSGDDNFRIAVGCKTDKPRNIL